MPAQTADLVIVNTCGFIDAAKEESIEAVLWAADEAHSRGARVAAVGCLVERYRAQLAAELPEIDVLCGFEQGPLLAALAVAAAGRGEVGVEETTAPRRRLARPLHAYVKISDGCDRRCAFCAIPLIKGRYETVPPERVLADARAGLESGARELVLVGQDTSRWAVDGYGALPQLLTDLAALQPLWLRLLYLQPDGVDGPLLEALAHYAVPYADIPLQHASGRVLRRMGRRGDDESYLALLARVRDAVPGVALRSTFITGFPGETEEDVEILVDFIEAAQLALAGVFVFDPQQGTRAAALRPRVPAAEAEERAARVVEAIERAASSYWSTQIGTTVDVLVEQGSRSPGRDAVGRIALQAPDVDGLTYLAGTGPLRRGQAVRAVIETAAGYDLTARAV